MSINNRIVGGQSHNLIIKAIRLVAIAIIIYFIQSTNTVYAYDIEQYYDSSQNHLTESQYDNTTDDRHAAYEGVKQGSRKDATGSYPTAAYDIKFKGLNTSYHASSKDAANADNDWRCRGTGGYFTAYRYEDNSTWYWSSSHDWRNVYISHQLIRVDNNTLVVQYTIHNNDNYGHTLDVAGNVDTMLGNNDEIPCYQETRSGIKGIRVEGIASGEKRKYYMIFDPTNYYVKKYSTEGTPAATYYANFYVRATNYLVNFNNYNQIVYDTTGTSGPRPNTDTGTAWCWTDIWVPAHSTKSVAYVFTAIGEQKQFTLDVNSAYYNWNKDKNCWEWKEEYSDFSKCKFKVNNSNWLTDYYANLDFGTQYTIKAEAISGWNIYNIADSDGSNGIDSTQSDKTTYTNNITNEVSKYIFVTPNFYKINFEANKPSRSINNVDLDTTSKQVQYTGPYGDLPTPSLTGYTFKGWYTSPTDGTQRTSSTILDTANDVTLYAHWEPNQYTLTFNGGTGVLKNPGDNIYGKNPYNSVPVVYDTWNYCYMGGDIPVKLGYTFSGWFRDDFYGEQIFDKNGTALESNTSCYRYNKDTEQHYYWQHLGDVTVTAHYTPNTYTIKLDSNKPAKSTNNLVKGIESVKATYDSKVPSDLFISSKQPSIEGWTFKGWFTQPEGGTKISVDTIYNWVASDTTLYAHWEENKYTIILDNGTSDYYRPLCKVTQPAGWNIDSSKNLYKTVGYEDEVEIKTAESYYSVDDYVCDGWYNNSSWNINSKNWLLSSDSSKIFKKLNSNNNGTIRVCALWAENKAPELELNNLDISKYRTYYEGQQITKEMLTQDNKGYTNILMSDNSLYSDKTSNNPDILSIKDTITFEFSTGVGDTFTWSKWNSNGEQYRLKTINSSSNYTVHVYAYDSGKVQVPDMFSNKKSYTTSDGKTVYYKETNKHRTNELVYSGNVNYNNYPNIDTNVKKIYRSENNIKTLDELKKFILDYQTTSDIEDNSSNNYWWNKAETTRKLKESLTVVSTDNELNQILNIINRSDLSTGLKQVVKVKVTDQFGKETVVKVTLIILDNHDTDMIESSEQNKMRYLPINLRDTLQYTMDSVLNSDDFNSDTAKQQEIKNSLYNKQNGSIQHIDKYGDTTILEY